MMLTSTFPLNIFRKVVALKANLARIVIEVIDSMAPRKDSKMRASSSALRASPTEDTSIFRRFTSVRGKRGSKADVTGHEEVSVLLFQFTPR